MAGRTTRTIAMVLAALLALTGLQAAPAAADTIVTIPDAAFRACLLTGLGASDDSALTATALAGITYLSCDTLHAQPIRDLTGAEHLTSIIALTIYDGQLTDVGPVLGLATLKDLKLSACGLHDLSPLTSITWLRSLYVPSNPIDDLSPLASLPALQAVDVSGVSADLAPVGLLPLLKYAVLGGDATTDYSFLGGLPELRSVTVTNSQARTLSSFGRPPKLNSLGLNGTALEDVSVLAELTTLTSLRLTVPQVADLSALAGLTKLQVLSIIRSKAEDLGSLAGLSALKYVDIRETAAKALPTAGWTNLVTLYLHHVGITDSLEIASLPSLTSVWIRGGQFRSLVLKELATLEEVLVDQNDKLTSVHVSDAPMLASIYLDNNSIDDLQLTDLPALSSLSVSGNKLNSPLALSGMTNLVHLWMASNELTDLDGVEVLTKLAELNVEGNHLTDLGPIAALPLATLKASWNKVERLPALSNAGHLSSVELASNELSDVSGLASAVPSLTRVWLQSNHLSDLSIFAGAAAVVAADYQEITSPEDVSIGVPVALPLKGPDGRRPSLRETGSVTDLGDDVVYLLPGQQSVEFMLENGPSTFSGAFRRTVRADGVFTKSPAPVVDSRVFVNKLVTLTVGDWAPFANLSPQWYLDGLPIAGATAWEYLPKSSDAGHQLTASVTGTRPGYTSVTRLSSTAEEVLPMFGLSAKPVLSGSARTGSTLTVATGRWVPPTRFSYLWFRSGHRRIRSATGPTYTITPSDLGKRIQVRVIAADWANPLVEDSVYTARVTQGPVHSATPTITGMARVGTRLRVVRGAWGPGKITFRYTWRRDGHAIARAHKSSYRLTRADAGHQITVAVRGDRSSYTAVTRVSAPVVVP